jgi:hypothetical protein
VRERIAYLFLIAMLILIVTVTFGVLGKGEYQPQKEEEGHASKSVLA